MITNISDITTLTTQGKNFRVQSHDDATWILTSAFVVFTMQSGFGLLESGSVSSKNEVNIMVKNAVDVICGGLTYWMFGYGLSFGDQEPHTNPFCGWGEFFVTADEDRLGWVYSKFFFQASFATTATTIVSGSMAERTKLEAYIVFSMLNTFVYCFPAHWMWGSGGWLQKLGVVDIAGAGPVHLVGGVTGLVATLILKPRHNRFTSKKSPQMGSPTNAVLGMFMLWWGWLGFNCGSTFGISGMKWKLAARSAVSTMCASIAGGLMGLLLSYIVNKRTFDVTYLINGLLGSLVAITALCAMAHPWEGLLIGMIGAIITIFTVALLAKLKIDDPVGCVGVHAMGGIWSLLSAGFFARRDIFAEELQLKPSTNGLINGGGFHQLGIQTLAVVTITVWTLVTSFVFLKLIDLIIGLRIPLTEELLGADIVEHGIGGATFDKKKKVLIYEDSDDEDLQYLSNTCNLAIRPRRQSHSLGKHPVDDAEIVKDLQNCFKTGARRRWRKEFNVRSRIRRISGVTSKAPKSEGLKDIIKKRNADRNLPEDVSGVVENGIDRSAENGEINYAFQCRKSTSVPSVQWNANSWIESPVDSEQKDVYVLHYRPIHEVVPAQVSEMTYI